MCGNQILIFSIMKYQTTYVIELLLKGYSIDTLWQLCKKLH